MCWATINKDRSHLWSPSRVEHIHLWIFIYLISLWINSFPHIRPSVFELNIGVPEFLLISFLTKLTWLYPTQPTCNDPAPTPKKKKKEKRKKRKKSKANWKKIFCRGGKKKSPIVHVTFPVVQLLGCTRLTDKTRVQTRRDTPFNSTTHQTFQPIWKLACKYPDLHVSTIYRSSWAYLLRT